MVAIDLDFQHVHLEYAADAELTQVLVDILGRDGDPLADKLRRVHGRSKDPRFVGRKPQLSKVFKRS